MPEYKVNVYENVQSPNAAHSFIVAEGVIEASDFVAAARNVPLEPSSTGIQAALLFEENVETFESFGQEIDAESYQFLNLGITQGVDIGRRDVANPHILSEIIALLPPSYDEFTESQKRIADWVAGCISAYGMPTKFQLNSDGEASDTDT